MDHTRNSLTLSWGASESDGGSPILHYVLERREGWKTSWTNPIEVKPEGQKLTCCVQNLKEGQDYYFRVFAENSVGVSRAIETETVCKPRSPFGEYGLVADVNNSIPLNWCGHFNDGGNRLALHHEIGRKQLLPFMFHSAWHGQLLT